MKKKRKIIEMTMGIFSGLDFISLVNKPAIELEFIALNDNTSNVTLAQIDKERKIITGPALIPNKEIYRYNPVTNEEYYVWFSEETVEEAAQKFLIEMKNRNVNVEHQNEIDGLCLVESWIVDDPETDKAKSLGYSVTKGTWMVSFKVLDDNIWNDLIKTEKVKGFSIEGNFIGKVSMNNVCEIEKKINEISDEELEILKTLLDQEK